MSEFFVNRFGGKGHIEVTGDESSNMFSARYIVWASNGWHLCGFHDKLVMITDASRLLQGLPVT